MRTTITRELPRGGRRRISGHRTAGGFPGGQATIQDGDVVEAFEAELPPQTRRPERGMLAVHHHFGAVADAQRASCCSESVMIGGRPRLVVSGSAKSVRRSAKWAPGCVRRRRSLRRTRSCTARPGYLEVRCRVDDDEVRVAQVLSEPGDVDEVESGNGSAVMGVLPIDGTSERTHYRDGASSPDSRRVELLSCCSKRRKPPGERAVFVAPNWTQNNNLPINSRLLCQLSYGEWHWPGGPDVDLAHAPELGQNHSSRARLIVEDARVGQAGDQSCRAVVELPLHLLGNRHPIAGAIGLDQLGVAVDGDGAPLPGRPHRCDGECSAWR